MKTNKLRAAAVAGVTAAAGLVTAGSLVFSAPATGQLQPCGSSSTGRTGRAPCVTTTEVVITTTTLPTTPSGGCEAVDGSVCSGDGLAKGGSTSSGCSTAVDKSVSSGCAPKEVTPSPSAAPSSAPAQAVSSNPSFAG